MNILCYICQEYTDHPSKNCPNVKCKNCGQKGHVNKFCSDLVQSFESPTEFEPAKKRIRNLDKETLVKNEDYVDFMEKNFMTNNEKLDLSPCYKSPHKIKQEIAPKKSLLFPDFLPQIPQNSHEIPKIKQEIPSPIPDLYCSSPSVGNRSPNSEFSSKSPKDLTDVQRTERLLDTIDQELQNLSQNDGHNCQDLDKCPKCFPYKFKASRAEVRLTHVGQIINIPCGMDLSRKERKILEKEKPDMRLFLGHNKYFVLQHNTVPFGAQFFIKFKLIRVPKPKFR